MTTEQEDIVNKTKADKAQAVVDEKDLAFTKFQRAVYTFLLVAFFALGSTIFVWVMEPNPYEENTYERELLTKQVYPGGEVRLKVKVTWTKTCYSKLRRNIVYSNGVLVPYEREIRLNKAGPREFVITQQLPEDAHPGVAKWVVITDWFCNPLQYFIPRSVDLEPLEFEILPKKGTSDEGQLQKMFETSSCLGRWICKPS